MRKFCAFTFHPEFGVTTPNGVYMEDEYLKSGTVVARKLVAALVPYFPGSGTQTATMAVVESTAARTTKC